VHREANTLALQVVCETVFSASIREDMPVIGDHLHVLMQHVVDRAVLPLPWLHELPLPRRQRADRALAGMDAIVDRMVAQSESTGFSGDDLISTFMAVRDDETGAPMSRQQLRDEVLTFLAAGHETTANALAFTLECLARYPAWQEALHEELTGQLGDRPVEFDDLQRLDLLRRVIDESMRLYPPAWSVERSAEEPDEIDGYAIARDDLAIVSMWAIHRHPDHWPDPQRFDPDRFTAQASAGRHRAAYLPFGLGPRMCIGKHFALFELQVILATLLRRVRVSPVSPAPPEVEALVTLRPRGGLPLTLSMR
jgi:cytochrome P450